MRGSAPGMRWRGALPHASDIHSLFVPTGRRSVRLDWRHPLAIPFVLSVMALSPLLLAWAGAVWGLRRVRLRRQPTKFSKR